jgi:hypothetical protein
VAFVLSDGPDPTAPDLPYLLGAGGKLEAMLAGMGEVERAEAERLAGIAVGTGRVLRIVVVPKAMPADRMACLESAVTDVIVGDAFRAAAEAEGRPVNPLDPQASQAALSELSQAMDAARTILADAP